VYVLLKACSAPPNNCVQYNIRVVIHRWLSVSEIANDNVKTIITTPQYCGARANGKFNKLSRMCDFSKDDLW
jgi:hypothetical protein